MRMNHSKADTVLLRTTDFQIIALCAYDARYIGFCPETTSLRDDDAVPFDKRSRD
jgi:hypothetical protein